MGSVIDICNRALSKIGESRITSLDDGAKGAEACNHAFQFVRDAVLRDHPWNFTVQRAELSPLSSAPVYGYNYQYTMPSDSIRILDVDTTYDWVVEGRNILSDEGPVLKIRYQKRVEDTTLYDPLLFEVMSARLAFEICEEITQSNSKKEIIYKDYLDLLTKARLRDAQEGSPSRFQEDDWIKVRY